MIVSGKKSRLHETQKEAFFLTSIAGKKDSMGQKSQDLQKAHLGSLLNGYAYNLKFLSQFGRDLCEKQTQKTRKMDQKLTFFEAMRVCIGAEKLNP